MENGKQQCDMTIVELTEIFLGGFDMMQQGFDKIFERFDILDAKFEIMSAKWK